jgi:hypothetical protein
MSKTREVPLVIEECAMMTTGVQEGGSLLGLGPGFDPAEAQDLIEDLLRRFRAGQLKESLDENAAAYLGLFWAMSIVLAYRWNWVAVERGDWRGFGVADSERRYLVLPVSYFHTLMHGERAPKWSPSDRFKAIGANSLRASLPGQFTVIAS